MEYQAKELFAKHGVAVTLGRTVETPEAAGEAAAEIGGVSVVKAQVKAGGRGKAGRLRQPCIMGVAVTQPLLAGAGEQRH